MTSLAVVCASLWLASSAIAAICPFCSAINLTFTEQLKSNDVVVIAKLLEIPPPSEDPDADLEEALFEVTQILKGKDWIPADTKFRTVLVGRYPIGENFLVMGVDPPKISWSTPMKASQRVVTYLSKLKDLPPKGADRLAFFQEFFEDKEPILAFDAYDEFAGADYEDLIALKPRMKHDQLVAWIENPKTSVNRRRLYFTMLGVCGNKDSDIKMLEEFIKSGDRKKQAGLDALLACYLTLKGDDGIDLIEKTFLVDKSVEYVDTLAAVSALRFHGTEVDVVSKKRIVKAIRILLDRPKMADMIIPDLARWKDWEVMPQLVQMFKDSNEETSWLKVPVINFLRACPKPEAKVYLAELTKLDPQTVEQANLFMSFGNNDDDDDDFGDDDDFEDDEDFDDDEKDSAESSEQKTAPATEPNAKDGQGAAESGSDKQSEKKKSIDQNMTAALDKDLRVLATNNEQPAEDKDLTSSDGAISAPVEMKTNPEEVTFVSMINNNPEPAATTGNERVAQIGKQASPPVPAAVTTGWGVTLAVVFYPMLISIAIFLLLCSVISGSFTRVISG